MARMRWCLSAVCFREVFRCTYAASLKLVCLGALRAMVVRVPFLLLGVAGSFPLAIGFLLVFDVVLDYIEADATAGADEF